METPAWLAGWVALEKKLQASARGVETPAWLARWVALATSSRRQRVAWKLWPGLQGGWLLKQAPGASAWRGNSGLACREDGRQAPNVSAWRGISGLACRVGGFEEPHLDFQALASGPGISAWHAACRVGGSEELRSEAPRAGGWSSIQGVSHASGVGGLMWHGFGKGAHAAEVSGEADGAGRRRRQAPLVNSRTPRGPGGRGNRRLPSGAVGSPLLI